MFTGIVEELGVVKNIALKPDSALLTISAHKVLQQTQIGDSIAVSGVCLTVISKTHNTFTADVMAETMSKTILKDLHNNAYVNLERALQLSTRLGGHLVTGHVDGIGTIRNITPVGIARLYEISAGSDILSMMLPKGSIAIDGISLTVVDVTPEYFSVSLIPHTFKETTLGVKKKGDQVNLETDIIGKYVAKLLTKNVSQNVSQAAPKTIDMDFLTRHGFV